MRNTGLNINVNVLYGDTVQNLVSNANDECLGIWYNMQSFPNLFDHRTLLVSLGPSALGSTYWKVL